MSLIGSLAASKLGGVLVKVGAPILADVVKRNVGPGAGKVVEKLGEALGVPATPEAVTTAIELSPEASAPIVRDVEAADPDYWQFMARADDNRAALLEREDARESFFSWGWRPAMCWLLIFLWAWNGMLLPVANAAIGAAIPSMPWEQLVAFSGLWLAIYGGGNTIKSVWGKA